MFRNMKYIWVMLLLTAIVPMVAFLWGDSLIMFIARQSIKQADVAQALEYYQRLETFFPASGRIPEARFYKAGIFIQKKPHSGRRIFRFTGYNDRVISQNIMAPNNDQDMIAALDILQELAQTELDKNNRWIKKYLPWFLSKTYYELGKGDKALEMLSSIDYSEPEDSWPLTTWTRIQMDKGNYVEIIKTIDEYLNELNNLQKGMTAELLEIKGDANLALGRLEDAQNSYSKAKEYVKSQFAWLCRQRFIMCVRPELLKENLENSLDTKLGKVELIREPLKIENTEGIYGNLSIGDKPIIGESVYMALVGEDILFSGSTPAAEVTYTDINGNFYFPEIKGNPVFGVGIPEEQANLLSCSIKADRNQRQPIYNLKLVPAIAVKSETQGDELLITFDSVPGTTRYELYLIPPVKESQENKEIAFGTIYPDKNSSQIIWKRNLDEIVSLKPFPLLYDEIKPFHIIGPLYHEQKSFLNIKAFDGNNNLLSDSLGFFIIGVNDENAPGISLEKQNEGDSYVTQGLYVHAAEEYERLLQKDPRDSNTMDKLIRLYLWAPGARDIMKAQEVMTKLKAIANSNIYRLQAEIDYQINEFERARQVLEGTLERNTLDPARYHILAQIYLHNREYEKSIKYFNQAYNLSGEKFKDYSPITAYCLISDFDEAYMAAKEIIYDGQRFFELLDVIQAKSYPPEVMKGFEKMLLLLTQKPDEIFETEFDKMYKDFKKLYPEHGELSEIAFKLAFRRFQH
ncbi:MAG: tetratricopeptide repeat protein [Tepidanaerobacteraceae bacterium]